MFLRRGRAQEFAVPGRRRIREAYAYATKFARQFESVRQWIDDIGLGGDDGVQRVAIGRKEQRRKAVQRRRRGRSRRHDW